MLAPFFPVKLLSYSDYLWNSRLHLLVTTEERRKKRRAPFYRHPSLGTIVLTIVAPHR
jgi:hypothetical protein